MKGLPFTHPISIASRAPSSAPVVAVVALAAFVFAGIVGLALMGWWVFG